MRYKKYLTVKQWMKFDRYVDREDGDDITMQEIITREYDVILIDHSTKSEKLKSIYQKVMKIDVDKTLTKISKGIDDFSHMMESMKGIGGRQRDLSCLFNDKSKKGQSQR